MIEQLCREILHPDKEFSPVPFWFFNDMPDEDKIRKQLTDYVDKGVNAIVLHPRIGVPVEIGYLLKEYIKAVRFIVKTADELVGDVVIYHKAEEMVECYCNDKLADVGFWAPYQIKIGRHLKSGKNKLKLIVTGNAANMYCDVNLPYGLINHK